MRRLTLALVALFFSTGSISGALAPVGDICFPGQPGITACLADPFASFWKSNGGLAVFGYPITSAQPERNPDSNQEFMTQWTERNRLELHPENPAPYTILLGRMGAQRLAQLGRDPASQGREPGPVAGCLWFEQTGHNVCDQAPGGGFKTYWQAHGLQIAGLDRYRRSLALFGLPLTSAQPETSADGTTIMTQWFERARFEWHPDNPNPYKVLLGLLGAEVRQAQGAPGGATPSPSVFGVTLTTGYAGAIAGLATDAHVSWVRSGGMLWSEVESTPGARDWSRLDATLSDLRALSAVGLTPIVIVRGTPEWAQQVAGHSCGAIKPEALDAFASFMRDLVARYSGPPYNLTYWEIWNEPDVDPALVTPDSGFGCWGNAADPYYGGGYFAEMLKRIYPAVKQANPAAQVVLGGLLLDCDAANPPPGKDCAPARFLEGVLRNGGAAGFDIVAYHGYSFWTGQNEDWDLANPGWRVRGGVVRGKLQFIRSTMQQYGVQKPVILDEAGLLCYAENPACQANFFNAQASYLVRLYARVWADQQLGAVWYTLEGPGWEKGGLLDASQSPRPAYRTLKFMAGLLQGASYAGPLANGAVEGYAFARGATRYEIYWTNDGSHVALALPAGARAVYDMSGQLVPTAGSSVDLSFNPIVIEIRS